MHDVKLVEKKKEPASIVDHLNIGEMGKVLKSANPHNIGKIFFRTYSNYTELHDFNNTYSSGLHGPGSQYKLLKNVQITVEYEVE